MQPEILIISNKHEYSADHVAFRLNNKGASYIRLNRDQFPDLKLTLIPTKQKLMGESSDLSFEISAESLKSIYFRAPVYLRDNHQLELSPEEQLGRSQWAAFLRALMVFDNVVWVNHPQATYRAEVKPYQLYIADKLGFNIPKTIITNTMEHKEILGYAHKRFAIKTLDSLVLSIGGNEAFIYTNIVDYEELQGADISSAPVILQQPLVPKIDIRVTVVGKKVYAVEIKKDNEGIDIDWRLEKDKVDYTAISLPTDIKRKCTRLIAELGLRFGAIDLALHNGKYYFVEVNPTGEWAWLVGRTGLDIDKAISRLLLKGNSDGE